MNFSEIALPFAELGIRVFPLQPGDKTPIAGMEFLKEATLNPKIIENWNRQNPAYNVAILADNDWCFLEFDVLKGMKAATLEMGQTAIPSTRVQRSGGGFGHYIFQHTDRSRKIGNRSRNLYEACTCDRQQNKPCNCEIGGIHHHHEWFSFRANNKYLVGAGSLHPSGRYYSTVLDVTPIPVPEWVCDFIEKHTQGKPKGRRTLSVDEGFDFDEFLDFFDISGFQDGDWFITSECPVAGYKHQQSTRTGFYWDGDGFGFNCFAQGCPGCEMGIGKVLRFLNDKKGEPYRGVIWTKDDDEPLVGVEMLDDEEPTFIVSPSPEWTAKIVPPEQELQEDKDFSDLAQKLKWEDEIPTQPGERLPAPDSIALEDPENHQGVEFPGACAMYGKLGEIAMAQEKLKLGWYYPSLLIVASCLDIEDADHTQWGVRKNMYGALLGLVHAGKNYHMEAARQAIYIPENLLDKDNGTVIEDAPLSHGGLANQLSENEPLNKLLFLDELVTVFNACAIMGSNLPPMLCSLWNKDKAGGSIRKSRQVVYGKLSILGGLAVADAGEFAHVFGASSVKGLYDRFLFGYYPGKVKFWKLDIRPTVFNLKPVHIPDWAYEAKNNWIDDDPTRGRMSEYALRIALVTAAVNGDREVTKPCLEAALRFVEWQCRLRQMFKPGKAETIEAEAFEAVWGALKEQYDKQRAGKIVHPKAVDFTEEELDGIEKWKLLHFRDVVNNKSYYRKYAGLIDRVKKSLFDAEIIAEFKSNVVVFSQEVGDEKPKPKLRRSPFVTLRLTLK